MKVRPIIISLIIAVSFGFSSDSSVWKKVGEGIYESDVHSILVDPKEDAVVYVGTSKALYKSVDGGKNYQMVLRPSGEQKGVNDIYIPIDQPEIVYAATDAGLYENANKSKIWQRIYHSSDVRSESCLSVIRDKNQIYLGTQNGLFHKTDQETNWQKMKGAMDNRAIYKFAGDQQFLYIATGQILFRLDKQTKEIQNIFSLGIGEERSIDEATGEVFASREDQSIKFIQVTNLPRSYIFLVTSKGIYFSSDHGKEWDLLPANNLALDDLTSLLILTSATFNEEDCTRVPMECLELFAGTKKGVFFLSNGKWIPVYKGMETNKVNDLAKNMRETVYAATEKGIFYLPIEKALPSFNNTQNFNITDFDNEPSINEVHQLAIDYAEVSHEKIRNWRRQAQRSAWFPSLDIGVDGNRDWSSSDSIWGSYTSGGQHYVGPDDKTRGEDIGWDVSLSWDLSDLVWNTDQTTIDSRSKLMVELREDILNEVTRLYFERRRMQAGIASSVTLDPAYKIDQEIRIAELTALIDALTGGEFSKRIH